MAIPRRGKTSGARRQLEQARPFRRLVKWRTGCEGRISQLKRGYGSERTLLDGIDDARIWYGYGVLAHNLVRVAGLIQTKQVRPA